MTNLTRISIITRKSIRYFIYSVIGIILIRAAILTSIKIYRHFYPAPPPAPTVSFGKLPALPFPKRDVPQDLSFSLQTPTGELPSLPLTSKVYYMPRPSSQLLSLDEAKTKASNLGYDPDGIEVTQTVYSFKKENVPSELRISIVTGVFSVSYNLTQDPKPLEKRPFAPEVSASKARSFLSSADLFAKDLTGPTVPEPVKLQEQKIIGAASLSEANFVKVNFFRKSYDDLPSVTPDVSESNVWLIISGDQDRDKQIMACEYHYFPVDETQSATYPIKTAEAAFEELKAQKGFIATIGSLENVENKNITIRRVYLGYYDAGVPTDFFQPVVVFEGDNNFVAYVPAVTADYYGE
jgi:hypothetical protein